MLTTKGNTSWRGGAIVATLFLISSVFAGAGLAGCDSGSAATPTPPSAGGNGQVVFERYCNVCHPGGGRGAGPSLIPLLPTLSDDQVRSIVRRGRQRMPGYDQATISDDSLTALIAYMR